MKHIKLALTFLGLLSCSFTFAQKTETMKEVENTNRRPFLLDDKLKLEDISTKKSKQEEYTEDQLESEIKKIRARERKQVSALKKQLNKKKIQLHALERADKVDMDTIYKSIDEIAKIRASIRKIKAENNQKIRALLSKEQRLFFDLIVSKKETGAL
ncbi:MAG: hypothetical protein LBC98_03180 [Prevotellaceae bacterium]|jgi:hypothetical protein|nr:hypothetical protein [Prevotellaceae bacterium]